MIRGYKMKSKRPSLNLEGRLWAAVGNRIFQETGIGTTNRLHDNANRLTNANRVSLT
jgi:hypothetical protein